MDLGTPKESGYNLTDEEDCSQDDDVADGGRRRRFCNERAKQHQHNNKLRQIKSPTDPVSGPSQSNSSKRQKLSESSSTSASLSCHYPPKQINTAAIPMGPRLPRPFARPARPLRRPMMPYGIRRKPPPPPPPPHSNDNQRCTTKKVFNTTNQLVPHDTVIFVNPIFIKKFLMKAMIMMHPPDVDNKQATTGMPVDSFSFEESPADALQAAATMAIIRLVTECIEDDSKRDEKSNKVLANRLMLQMKEFPQRTEPNMIQFCHGPDLEPKLLATP